MSIVMINFDGTYYLNTATTNTNFGPKSLVPLYSDFRCYGNESSLANCSYSSTLCSYYGRTDAAVRCVGDIVSGNASNMKCLLHVITSAVILIDTCNRIFASLYMQAPVFKAAYIWLVPMVLTQLKGE